MKGRGESPAAPRGRIVYCVVPRDLARLHDPLRRHFAGDPSVEVVVERRGAERRGSGERREAGGEEAGARAGPPAGNGRRAPILDRRRILARAGRRVADRRVALVPVLAPALPRKARAFAERIVFAERLLPSSQHAEDVDTARLVTRFQGGEGEVFGELYMRYFDRVYGYLLVALADSHEAEDAAQQVFTRLLEALPKYELRAQPFRAWLFVIVRNLALDTHAKHSRLDVVDPGEMARRLEEGPGHETDLDALSWISDRELVMFVERLPIAQRQVLVLRYMLGLDSREIARVLDRTPADVRMLQARALRFLEERLTRVGRGSARQVPRSRMGVCVRPAQVLRSRRFALRS